MTGYGSNTDRILLALEEYGELTQAQLSRALGIESNTVAAALHRIRRATPKMPKRAYIKRWVSHDIKGAKSHLRPVFARGAMPDAPKPEPTTNTMWAQKRRRMIAARHSWSGVVRAQSAHELHPPAGDACTHLAAGPVPGEAAAPA